MEVNYCQSCGMPLENDEVLGINKDSSLNREYCSYCFDNGEFTSDCTMAEMIDVCAEYTNKWVPPVTREEAIAQMRQFFPTLKRWKTDS
ncbi:MAG: zinc ribbon domain-containing protein [Prevotellaceae bacterium]|jgi:hypothetical protein|nr:zinc ribbon domain-containing protein [Prevotellaceae bacterium]